MKSPALILCPEPPYPLNGGGALRSAALLQYLAEHYTVDAIFFREFGGKDPSANVPAGLIQRSVTIDLPVHSKATVPRAARNLRRCLAGVPPLVDRFSGREHQMLSFLNGEHYELSVMEHSWCMPYLPMLRAVSKRCVLDLHNIESILHSRCAESEPSLQAAVHKHFAAASRALEQKWFPSFDLLLTTSDTDQASAFAISPRARVANYPNTIPWRDRPVATALPRLVFSANFEYHPNRTAVAWFVRNVWPTVKNHHPDLELLLTGRNEAAVRPIIEGQKSIVCTGEVDDTFPYVAASRIALAPLQSGSGTRLKILEAFAAGVPVVSTPIGAEGLPVHHGQHLLLAADAEAFATAISTLLSSHDASKSLSDAARLLFEEEFTWQAGWRVLSRLGI